MAKRLIMRTINVSAKSKTVNELLKKAKGKDLILRSTDGDKFLLIRITETQGFYMGDSDDFAVEVEMTRKNKDLMKFLDKRRAQSKGKKGIPLEEVKRQLGLS
jgi:hypothetical protein